MEYYGFDFKTASGWIKEMLTGAGSNPKARTQIIKQPLNMDVTVFDYYKKFEAAYWVLRGIDVETLIADNVFPLKMLRINKEFKSTSSSTNPKFVYFLNEERSVWKVFSPLDREFTWMTFNTNLVPYESPPENIYEDLIIFNSKKDRLVFKTLHLPYDTTSLIEEGNFKGLLKELPKLDHCKNIWALLDFDSEGENYTAQIEAQSGGRIKGLSIPNNIWNFLESVEVRNLDDVRVKLGALELRNMINKILPDSSQ